VVRSFVRLVDIDTVPNDFIIGVSKHSTTNLTKGSGRESVVEVNEAGLWERLSLVWNFFVEVNSPHWWAGTKHQIAQLYRSVFA